MVSRFCVRPTSKRWFLKITQVTVKHDPFDAITYSVGPSSVVWSGTWTSSAFSTNESPWNVMVTGSRSRVWSGHKGLFTPWTMKSSEGPAKPHVIGCWTRPRTTLVYTEDKMLEWSWSLRSPKDIFQDLHYSLTWSDGFCDGRGKRGAMVEKGKGPWHRNIIIMKFWWNFFDGGIEDDDKRRQKNGQNCHFWTYIKKNQHNHFVVRGHSSWSTFNIHLVKSPKAL